ncbi:MAG TPA: CBS domain-containing protein [Candidatus Binataceae bacterium]|nr:CBS domain-containing protein [Candidatus Binataceae bacterium]
MKVENLMTAEVRRCQACDTLNTAAQIMWDADIGCVPVVDPDGRVIGMVTDRDISMAAYLQGVRLIDCPVTSAMSKEVYSCGADDDLADAERMMREKRVRRLAVIDEGGIPVGVISLADIAREAERVALSATDAELTRTLASISTPRHRIAEAQAE